MGLKDLIASKSSLAEDVIEEIVSEYVRYDTDHKAVFLTPEGHELSGKSKVLVYLVALQGWPFVIDDVVPTDPKPGEIEEHTGIPGGTLRPLLRYSTMSPVPHVARPPRRLAVRSSANQSLSFAPCSARLFRSARNKFLGV